MLKDQVAQPSLEANPIESKSQLLPSLVEAGRLPGEFPQTLLPRTIWVLFI